jgi:folate-binding protein YgfZ
VFASEAALDALRIAAYQASFAELDEKSLPHELELLATAVHLTKGCYRGQETVAKVHNLGHPPRRLVLLHLDGSEHELPAVGSSVFIVGMDKAPCGRVTSVAQHHEMGPIALAVIVRRTPEDAPLVIQTDFGPVSATQEVIVPVSAGRTADVPKLPKLKLGARI